MSSALGLTRSAAVQATAGPHAMSMQAATMHDMAGQAKQYLDQVFQDQPATLRRVQQAYDQEASQRTVGAHKPGTPTWLFMRMPLAWVNVNGQQAVTCLLQTPGSMQTRPPCRDRQSTPPWLVASEGHLRLPPAPSAKTSTPCMKPTCRNSTRAWKVRNHTLAAQDHTPCINAACSAGPLHTVGSGACVLLGRLLIGSFELSPFDRLCTATVVCLRARPQQRLPP